jgi:hypothetical protein
MDQHPIPSRGVIFLVNSCNRSRRDSSSQISFGDQGSLVSPADFTFVSQEKIRPQGKFWPDMFSVYTVSNKNIIRDNRLDFAPGNAGPDIPKAHVTNGASCIYSFLQRDRWRSSKLLSNRGEVSISNVIETIRFVHIIFCLDHRQYFSLQSMIKSLFY